MAYTSNPERAVARLTPYIIVGAKGTNFRIIRGTSSPILEQTKHLRLRPNIMSGPDLRLTQNSLGHRDPRHNVHDTCIVVRRFEGIWI